MSLAFVLHYSRIVGQKIKYTEGVSRSLRESFRTIYEMSNHFFTLSNSSAPYVKLILERKDYRPEAIDQFYDNPGLGTFTYN